MQGNKIPVIENLGATEVYNLTEVLVVEVVVVVDGADCKGYKCVNVSFDWLVVMDNKIVKVEERDETVDKRVGNNKPSGNVLVQWLVALLLLISLLNGAKAYEFCDTDSAKLALCYAAVTGKHPPKPNEKCCEVIRHADLPCLCRYKNVLPAAGINPTNALTLPSRCGLKTPPECKGQEL
ncbi:hypothetical protein RIF29_01991 [Crotalaria pallida]|uniref:Bifunctional inhibitor/plant lipid transfer protein/seed storage helical domain-containing protein n=1 Tax=Crotalaria pallida TaxID=3830 RepID=A0AAN9P7Q9_CROPI